MTICASCGVQNVDGARFCAKCGGTLAPSPAPMPGAWQTPSGDLQNPGSAAGYGNAGSYASGAASSITSPSYADVSTGFASGHLNYAQWVDRLVGAIIDGALVIPVFLLVFAVLYVLLGLANWEGAAPGLSAIIAVLPVVIFNKIYLVGTRGASVGQGIMKLKVVDASGNAVTMGKALARQAVALGLGFIPCVGTIAQLADGLWPLWDQHRQTLHDKAASTFVIKTV